MNVKVKPLFKRALPYLISSLISMIVGLVMFKVREIAPLGERSVLSADLWGQYFSMYVNNKLTNTASGMLYSWNGSFGFNNWVQSAYYCNSVFLLLFKIIPISYLVKALDLFCLFKMMLAAPSCLYWMRHKSGSKNLPVLIAGGCAYSLCAYMLAYTPQFMWTDCLIYAPLILAGIDRLIEKQKPLLYTLMLALSIATSFYIGFALCIFSVLYFLACAGATLTYGHKGWKPYVGGWKNLLHSAVSFGLHSILAGALTAMFVIPVGLAISLTIASESKTPEAVEWYGNISQVLQELLPQQTLKQEYTGANLFCGTIVFLAIPLYFMNAGIRRKERLLNGGLMLFLLASLNMNYLNYFWHGLHFPNQLPGRWSFLFSLFAVYLSTTGLASFAELPFKRVLGGCVLGLSAFYLTAAGVGGTERAELTKFAWVTVFVMAFLMILTSFLCHVFKDGTQFTGKKAKFLCRSFTASVGSVLIALCSVADSGINFVKVSTYEGNKGFMTSEEPSYSATVQKHCEASAEWRCDETDFYRVEPNSGFTFNPSMLGDYHGMGRYSSTMTGSVFKFLRGMGNRIYGDLVSSVYTLNSPVQNSLFGIRYVMDFDKSYRNVCPGWDLIAELEKLNVYENPTCLPIAYPVAQDAISYHIPDLNQAIHAIEEQNQFLNALCGEQVDVYKPIPCEVTSENVGFLPSDDWNANYFTNETAEKITIIRYTMTAPQEGDYFYEHNFRAGKLHITGAAGNDSTFAAGQAKFGYTRHLNAGDQIQIEATLEGIGLGCCGLNFYRFDSDAWNRAYQKLSNGQLQVTKFKNTRIEGEITLSERMPVMATIPQDGGWRVYCDGDELPTTKIADTLLCAYIPAGTHKLVIKYHVPGLGVGMIISFAAIGLLILIHFRPKKKATALAETPAGDSPAPETPAADAPATETPAENPTAENVPEQKS